MSNKRYRTPAYPAVSPEAINAAMNGESDHVPSNDELVAQMKRVLSKVLTGAEETLAGTAQTVSVREGLMAARSLLSVLKHEQRLKERVEQAEEKAAAAKAPATVPRARLTSSDFDAFMRDMAHVLAADDPETRQALSRLGLEKAKTAAPPEPAVAA